MEIGNGHATKADLAGIREIILDLAGKVDALRGDVGALGESHRTEMNALRADVNTLRTDMGALRVDVNTLRTDMDALRAEFQAEYLRLAERLERAETTLLNGFREFARKIEARTTVHTVLLGDQAATLQEFRERLDKLENRPPG